MWPRVREVQSHFCATPRGLASSTIRNEAGNRTLRSGEDMYRSRTPMTEQLARRIWRVTVWHFEFNKISIKLEKDKNHGQRAGDVSTITVRIWKRTSPRMVMALFVSACDNAPASTRRYWAAVWRACAPAWSTCSNQTNGPKEEIYQNSVCSNCLRHEWDYLPHNKTPSSCNVRRLQESLILSPPR